MVRWHPVFVCVVYWTLLSPARPVHAATLTVLWDRSTDASVAGYVVSYGTESGTYTARVVADDSTSVTVTGLRDATTYYVVVQSFTRDGILGPPSPAAVGRTSPAVLSIACPAPVLTSLDGRPIQVTLLPSVAGGTQPVTLRCSPASGSLFPLGTVAFSCTAVDAAQQWASCASAAVVLPP